MAYIDKPVSKSTAENAENAEKRGADNETRREMWG
jgi:hypothetical protein